MFLASTPPKQTQKATVNDYFDSESDCSNQKNVENGMTEKSQYQINSQSNQIINRYDKIQQREIEKLRGQNAISSQLITDQLQQKDIFKFQYFSSDKKQLSPDNDDQSDEEDLNYFKQNPHIFTKSVLAEKKLDFNNQTDKITKVFSIDKNSSFQGEKELIKQDNNQQQSQGNPLVYQLNSSLIPLEGQSKQIKQDIVNSQTNNQIIKINNIFDQNKQLSIENNQINQINQLQININNYNPLKQQTEEKGATNFIKEGQMIKTENLLNIVENSKMFIEIDSHLKEINHQNFDDNILQDEIEIEINNSDNEFNSISDEDEIINQNRDQQKKIQEMQIKSKSKEEQQNELSISLEQQCKLNDQNSNQSMIGFLKGNNSEISNQQQINIITLQESSTESENSRNFFIKKVDLPFNQNKSQSNQLSQSVNNINGNGLPDPFSNEKYFQKKPNSQQYQEDQGFFSFAKAKKTLEYPIKVSNNFVVDQDKRKNIFLNQQANFSKPELSKQNKNYQKFELQFEDFDENSQDIQQNFQNQKLQEKQLSDQPSQLAVDKVSNDLMQDKMTNKSISQKDILFGEFNISSKVQQNKKFSKFLDFFEEINDEDEQIESVNKKSQLGGQTDQINSLLENNFDSNQQKQNEDIGFNFAKPKSSINQNGLTNSKENFTNANSVNKQLNKQPETQKNSNIIQEKMINEFKISSKVQQNEKFSKFIDFFEEINNEEGEQEEQNNDDFMQNDQKKQQINEEIQFQFQKPFSSSGFNNAFQQTSKVNFGKPQANKNLDTEKQQEKSTKPNILQDKFVTGFKISSKVQKDEKFSKFVNMFEEISDEPSDQDELTNEGKELQYKSAQEVPKIEKVKHQQEAFTKPNILQDKFVTGFKISSKVQKDEKFSKFVGLFEEMSDESEQDSNQEEFQIQGNQGQGIQKVGNKNAQFQQAKQQIAQNKDEKSFSGFSKPKFAQNDQISQNKFEISTKIKANNEVQPQMNGDDVAPGHNQSNNNYDDFFSKQSDNNQEEFVGFKSARNNKKLEVDEKVIEQLTKIFDKNDAKNNEQTAQVNSDKSLAQKNKANEKKQSELEEEEQANQINYDDFFSNKTSNTGGFFGFKTANNKRNLEVSDKTLDKYSLEFDRDEAKSQKSKNSKSSVNDDLENEEDDNSKYDDFFSNKSDVPFAGFKIVKGNKEIKPESSKFMEYEKSMYSNEEDSKLSKPFAQASRVPKRTMNFEDDEEFQLEQKQLGSKMLKVDTMNKNKSLPGSIMKDSYSNSNGFKNTPMSKSDNKDKFNSNSRLQNSESSFSIGFQKSVKSATIEEEDDDDDAFSRFIKKIKKPEPKRTHPKPFRQVKVVDSSKTTPITKETPTIKSMKIDRRANQKKLLMSDESANSFLFAKDSVGKSGQKSGKSSTLSKKFKPQSIEKINESVNNKELMKKSKEALKQGNRYSFINEEDEDSYSHKRQLFNSSSKKSNPGSCMKHIPVALNHQYLNNPLIQLKYNYDSQIARSNFVRFDELKVKRNQMEIESDNYVGVIQNMAKDINQCLYYQTMCNCLRKDIDNLLNFQENSFTQRIECFCQLAIPSTEPPEEEENAPKKVQQVDDILEYNKNKLQKGFLNYLNFFAKLQQKEKNLEEKWVRNHFRQVVWKLSCYENNLQQCPVNKKLTVENIYYELEYRLYSEVYACKRSILKQIQEQDAVKSINMILIVANITKINQYGCYVLELSDGWYSFYVVVFDQKYYNANDLYQQSNKVLQLDLIKRNKIYIGMKMYVSNLAKPSIGNLENMIQPKQNILFQTVYEIYYNNIIKAPANSKLGICSNSMQKYFPRSLKSIKPCGGDTIQCIDAFIVKKYPLCYEAGNVKVSFCNPKQMEDEGMDGGKQLGFTVLVVDSLSYYDEKFKIDEQPWVQVNIHSVTQELYDSLKEGSRIRLYNLKINNRGYQKTKFNYRQQRVVNEILYLETNKKTKIEEMGTFIKSKEDQQSMKKFGLELTENYKFLLEDVQESFVNLQYDKAIHESLLIQYKVEMDIIMYIVKIEDGTFFGINQNYSAICIAPINEIRQSTNSIFKKKKVDDECSLEDAHLYEKLSKNREIKVNQVSEKSNQSRATTMPNPEEGKIGVFLNSTLSTSHLEKYHFHFTFNTYKKTYPVDNLNVQSLPYSDKYKKQINELNEFLEIGSDKFQEVQNYIRNSI